MESTGTAARPVKHMCIASAHRTIASVRRRVLDPLTGHSSFRVLRGGPRGSAIFTLPTVRGTQGRLTAHCVSTQICMPLADHGYSRDTHRILTAYSRGTLICRPLTPPTAPVSSETLATAAATENGTTVASSSNAKAIAGGIGGAVAFVLLIVGAVILRKTCRTLKEKDAAKPDASAHELQRKDRPDSLKLAAGASLGTNPPPSWLVTAGPLAFRWVVNCCGWVLCCAFGRARCDAGSGQGRRQGMPNGPWGVLIG